MKVLVAVAFIRFNALSFSIGNDLFIVNHVTNKKTCEKYCEENKRCKGYVFSRQVKKCFLKDNLNGFKAANSYKFTGIKVNKPN